MKNNIPLSVLDEYTKRLSNNQVDMLYENKMHKPFSKKLYEAVHPSYKMYLDSYTLNEEFNTNKIEFIMWLNNNHASLMESLTYKIDEDGVLFTTKNTKIYTDLMNVLRESGMDTNVILNLRDKKLL